MRVVGDLPRREDPLLPTTPSSPDSASGRIEGHMWVESAVTIKWRPFASVGNAMWPQRLGGHPISPNQRTAIELFPRLATGMI